MAADTDAIFDIISHESGIDTASIRPEATFEELDINSLDFASALFTLEEEFGIEIDPDDFTPRSTIADLVAFVSSQSDE